jgi:hypothetical protein
MFEWPQCESCGAVREGILNGRFGPEVSLDTSGVSGFAKVFQKRSFLAQA